MTPDVGNKILFYSLLQTENSKGAYFEKMAKEMAIDPISFFTDLKSLYDTMEKHVNTKIHNTWAADEDGNNREDLYYTINPFHLTNDINLSWIITKENIHQFLPGLEQLGQIIMNDLKREQSDKNRELIEIQKIESESKKDTSTAKLTHFQSSLKNVEIDFNQVSPDYYLGKANELRDRFRIKFEITKEFIERNGNLATGNEVGEIGTLNPEWPNNPPEAFELLKEYYAKEWLLLGEIVIFLNRFYSWNEKAMIEKLEEINQFITEASKIPLKIAFDNKHRFFHEMPKIVYLRIDNNYYSNNHIQYDIDAKVVYGKYFLFKELLEQKLNIKPEKQKLPQLSTNLTNDQRERLFELLVNDKFIPDNTDPDCFKWIFGNPKQSRPDQWKPIKWNKSKQAFWELLEPILGTITNQHKRDIEKLFLDENNNPLNKLRKPKKDEVSALYGDICGIIDKIKIKNLPTSPDQL